MTSTIAIISTDKKQRRTEIWFDITSLKKVTKDESIPEWLQQCKILLRPTTAAKQANAH